MVSRVRSPTLPHVSDLHEDDRDVGELESLATQLSLGAGKFHSQAAATAALKLSIVLHVH